MKKALKSVSLAFVLVLFLSVIPAIRSRADDNPYAAWISIFDPAYYTANNAEAAAYAGGDINRLWQYFVNVGIPKMDQASAEFNVLIYAKNYPQLVQAYGGNIIQYYIHYATAGKAAGMNAKTLIGTSQQQAVTYSCVSLESLKPFAQGGVGVDYDNQYDDAFGNTYAYALIGISPYNEAGWEKYYLSGKGKSFTAVVAATQYSSESSSPDSNGVIRIYGDGRLLWSNDNVTIETHPYQINVDVSGVQDLQIEMRRGPHKGRQGVWPLLGNPVIYIQK